MLVAERATAAGADPKTFRNFAHHFMFSGGELRLGRRGARPGPAARQGGGGRRALDLAGGAHRRGRGRAGHAPGRGAVQGARAAGVQYQAVWRLFWGFFYRAPRAYRTSSLHTRRDLNPNPKTCTRLSGPRKASAYIFCCWLAPRLQKMQNPTGTACAAAPRLLKTLARAGSLRAASGRFLKTLGQNFSS